MNYNKPSHIYFGRKCYQKSEKNPKIHKDFELYKVLVYSFLCQNDKILIKILELFKSLCVAKCFNTTDAH